MNPLAALRCRDRERRYGRPTATTVVGRRRGERFPWEKTGLSADERERLMREAGVQFADVKAHGGAFRGVRREG